MSFYACFSARAQKSAAAALLVARERQLFEIVQRPALPQLKKLYLHYNQIGDVGMQALAGAVSKGALPQLKELYLHRNQISDDGFATLMPLLNKDGKLSGLTRFGIGSGITDKGMKEFADILSSGALDHLTVCWLLTPFYPCPETRHVHSPDPEVLFDVQYAGAPTGIQPDRRHRHDQAL